MSRSSICRLCLHKNDLDCMKNIFEFNPKYFKINLSEILYWIFDVEIIVEDSFSKLICYKCLNLIESIGKVRQFFQTNQTILLEKRCPDNYKVQSGWYNTRDIGTNTPIVQNETEAYRKSESNIAKLGNQVQTKVNNHNVGKDQIWNEQQNAQEVISKSTTKGIKEQKGLVKWLQVSADIFENFNKSPYIKTNTAKNKASDCVDVPANIFNYYPSLQVHLPNLDEECENQGYSRVGNKFYQIKQCCVKVKKIDCDKRFLRYYRKSGKFTYRRIPQLMKSNQKCTVKNKQLIQDYYYRMQTSAIQELLTDSNPQKNKQNLAMTSLVKTNEIQVYVCECCSRVFRYKHNLNDHYLKEHRNLNKQKDNVHKGEKSCTLLKNRKENYMNPDEFIITDLNGRQISPLFNDFSSSNTITEQENVEVAYTEKDLNKNPLGASISSYPSMINTTASHSGFHASDIRIKNMENTLNGAKKSETLDKLCTEAKVPMDYLKTVIFGEYPVDNPKITYHEETTPKSNLEEHDYAGQLISNSESQDSDIIRRKERKKLDSKSVYELKETFAKVTITRESLETLKKIRFALYNEIENSKILASLKVVKRKLQAANES